MSTSASHTVAAALLGAWILGTLMMWVVATQNFRTVDRTLERQSPDLEKLSQPLGAAKARTLLRHLASEMNRFYFRIWGWTQVVLGGALLFLWLLSKPIDWASLTLLALMLAIVLILLLVVTPVVGALGRSLDFVPRHPPPPELARFARLHAVFTVLDGVKLLVGITVLIRGLR